MISAQSRLMALNVIDEAKNAGASCKSACESVGIDERTYFRWKKKLKDTGLIEDLRPTAKRPSPVNKLSLEEEEAILDCVNSLEFADSPPTQIVPALTDRGEYLGSESTFYRVLRKRKLLHHRRKSKLSVKRVAPTYSAIAPNQVWTWDITYLPGPIKGQFYYLYLISDLYSRSIVGWEIWEEQTAEHASELIRKTILAEKIKPDTMLILHSDNGSPMKGATMLATLQSLGIKPSFSRPRVSNDNAFAESLFNTYKSRPGFKGNGFVSLEAARAWTQSFVQWYRYEHHHRGIAYLTPAQRHNGDENAVVEARKAVYNEAKAKHPERWNGRSIRNWDPPKIVYLNPTNATSKEPGFKT